MKIKRQVSKSPESCGLTEVEEKILDIPIKPGMLEGTEIVFPNEGDEGPTIMPGKYLGRKNMKNFSFAKAKLFLVLQLILSSKYLIDHMIFLSEKEPI